MKKFLLILICIFFITLPTYGEDVATCENLTVDTYANDDSTAFGLKCEDGTIITDAIYPKLIRLSDHSWIVQERNKFGIINKNGEYIIKPKYRHAERFFGKFAKLGNTNDYGLYNADGDIIIPPHYTKIETLFGKMFLTYKNYKYGVVDMEGKELLPNKFDDIYMPNFTTMRIKYKGNWFEIEKIADKDINLANDSDKITIGNNEYKLTQILVNSGIISGYSALTLSDYVVKIISCISPAYEDTIDELMLSHGTDTVSIFMGFGWLIKFPATYLQKYYTNLVTPNNGPLSEIRENLKNQIK